MIELLILAALGVGGYFYINRKNKKTPIISNIMTAAKGKLSESGEQIVENNKITILQQKIRESQTSIDKSEQALIKVMANVKQFESGNNVIEDKVHEYGDIVTKCLEKGENDLATEVAEKILELEGELSIRKTQLEKLVATRDILDGQRKKSNSMINLTKQKMALLEAQESLSESLRLTQEAVGSKVPGISEIDDMIAQIESKQAHEFLEVQASEELHAKDTNSELGARLENAGVSPKNASVQDILARYKPLEKEITTESE